MTDCDVLPDPATCGVELRSSADEPSVMPSALPTNSASATAGPAIVIDYDDPATKHYSCASCLAWGDLPHFQYRRLLHHFFANKHFYHPTWLPRGTSIAAAANLASCTIGVGTLSIPLAIHAAGVLAFFVLSGITFALTVFSIYLLCKCVDATKLHSFEMMTRQLFNSRRLELLVEIFMIVNCFGSAMAYIVVIGDISQDVGGVFSSFLQTYNGRVTLQLIVFVAGILPLSLLRTMDSLKFASLVGIIAILFLIMFVTVSGLLRGTLSNFVPVLAGSGGGMMSALPLIFFSFSNQINAIEIYAEMNPRSPSQFTKITIISVGGVYLAYCLVGFGGLAIYGAAVKGNVLNNFGQEGMPAFTAIAFLGIFCKVILTFPMNVFPAREALLHMIGEPDVHLCSQRKHVLSTIAVCGGALLAAVFVPAVNVLFGLLGAVCASLFGFILPVALAMRVEAVWSPQDVNPGSARRMRITAVAMLTLGTLCATVGSYYSLT